MLDFVLTGISFSAKIIHVWQPRRRTEGKRKEWGHIFWFFLWFKLGKGRYMSNQFSKALVTRITKYFAEYHNTAITEEQAQEYLDSFADLIGKALAIYLQGLLSFFSKLFFPFASDKSILFRSNPTFDL